MNIIDLATKTMQNTTKSIVDSIKAVVDTINTKVDNINTKTNAIDTNLNVISTNIEGLMNGGGVVKSVQRGTLYVPDTSTKDLTASIAAVNPLKSQVNLYGSANSGAIVPYVLSLTNNALTIRAGGQSGTYYYNQYIISWEVVEFY